MSAAGLKGMSASEKIQLIREGSFEKRLLGTNYYQTIFFQGFTDSAKRSATKKPRCADNGDGCGDLIIMCFAFISGILLCMRTP